MGINLPRVVITKKVLRRLLSMQESTEVPKGHLAVYVGESEKKRFTIPISYLKHHSFKYLLDQAEKEFGYNHSMGGLTIPCSIGAFNDLVLSMQ